MTENILYRRIRSTIDPKIEGVVVGAGYLKWPEESEYVGNGDKEVVEVFIVKVGEAPGSNSDPEHSLVCKVIRVDRSELLDDQARG